MCNGKMGNGCDRLTIDKKNQRPQEKTSFKQLQWYVFWSFVPSFFSESHLVTKKLTFHEIEVRVNLSRVNFCVVYKVER